VFGPQCFSDLFSVLNGIIDLVLPPICLACKRPVWCSGGLCSKCWSDLVFIDRPFCDRTGIPFSHDPGPGTISAEAIVNPPPYRRARSATIYTGTALKLVRGLKYGDSTYMADLIGRLTSLAGRDLFSDTDFIVPIPLHRLRLITRRFNQAGMIASSVAAHTGLPFVSNTLKRVKFTTSQVGLSAKKRVANVSNAFLVTAEGRSMLSGKNVVLVDDVITTGSTAVSITRALLEAGVSRVDVLTFARVPLGMLATEFSPTKPRLNLS